MMAEVDLVAVDLVIVVVDQCASSSYSAQMSYLEQRPQPPAAAVAGVRQDFD